MGATLGDLVAWYDELGFVGRSSELERIQELLDQPNGSIVLVHGPGGIGKSALLREAARRAAAVDRPVVSLDLRDATPSPEVLAPTLDAAGLDRPVVTIDTFEHVAALAGYLRREVLPSLPMSAVVLIASRLEPDNAWRSSEWDRLTTEIELQPLSVAEARALLGSRGLVEPAAVTEVLRWTGGNPLGLALAAEHAQRGEAFGGGMPPAAVATELTRRLLDTDVAPVDEYMHALVVASIARVTTPALLRAVLDSEPLADDAWSWLIGRSFLTRSGLGLAPHELLSRALRAEVKASSPEIEQALRRKVVDTLAADALANGSTSTADLVHLVDDPAIRWGFGVNATTHHLDQLKPTDIARIRGAAGHERLAAYAPLLEPWLDDGDWPYVVRDSTDRLAGVGLAFNSTTAPDAAWRDPFVGPRLEHARTHFAGEAVVWHSAVNCSEDPTGAVQGLLGIGAYTATSTPNPAASYIVITPSRPAAVAFATAARAVRVPELDAVAADGTPVQVHVIDHGEGGLVQSIHRTVYGELGLPPAPVVPQQRSEPGFHDRAPDLETVRAALRVVHLDRALAATNLADRLLVDVTGTTARAVELRRLLLAAIDAAWPDPTCLERSALTAAYFDPQREDAAGRMHMSRSSWFRLLRRALDGVVDAIDPDPVLARST
jgi:hypothetical protein